MAPRANWKGYLKLSLVSCAVALFPAATSTRERVRFNIINRETGNRVRYDVVDAETGEEVPQEDRVKGYKVDGDSYVLLEEKELDDVALESTHTIEIESFVEREDVDELYLDESYYLVPDDKVGYEAFAVIREAMREEGLVGIARVVLYRRERLLMLSPRGKGIVGTTLRYNNEVRDEQDYFDDIPDVKVSKDMLESGEAHPADQEGQVRSVEIRGSLRDRAQGADRGQSRPARSRRPCRRRSRAMSSA